MKKVILIILSSILLILTGCTSSQKLPAIIKDVQRPEKLVEVKAFKGDMWENSVVVLPKETILIVKNITNEPVNILWSESSFNNNPIFKNGMKFIDAGKSPANTVLFPQSQEEIVVYDSAQIEYSSQLGWFVKGHSKNNFPLKLIITFEQNGVKERYMTQIDKSTPQE